METKQIAVDYEISKIDYLQGQCYSFYNLLYNGKSFFDAFLETIEGDTLAQKQLKRLYAQMEKFGQVLLPKKIYRKIQNSKCPYLYEFKGKNIRIYVLEQRPDMYIILGGFKNTQKQDISKAIKHATAYLAQNNQP